MNWELPDVQAGFRKGRGTRDQIAIVRWNVEKAREFQKNIYFCLIDYTEAFDCMDHTHTHKKKLWKILKDKGIPDHLICLLRNVYKGQEQQLEPDMENKLVPNWERSTSRWYIVTLLTYMQSTSCKMLSWMKHKLESRLLGEISITSDMQMTPLR